MGASETQRAELSKIKCLSRMSLEFVLHPIPPAGMGVIIKLSQNHKASRCPRIWLAYRKILQITRFSFTTATDFRKYSRSYMYAFCAIYDSQAPLGSASNALWLWHPGVAIALLASGALGKAIAEGYPRPKGACFLGCP